MTRTRSAALAGALIFLVAPVLSLDSNSGDSADPNSFQFVRIRYNGFGGMIGSFRMGEGPPWMHDYPRAERNFLKILLEVTSVETTPDSYLILDLDDERIFNYPFLYVSEPGYWNATPREIANLGEYFKRGGFVVFDDFRGSAELNTLVSVMRRVDPEGSFRKLTPEDSVFHCFYDIEALDMVAPYRVPGKPTFYGWFDRDGRLEAVANHNNDIGDYWEWSDDSINPIAYSNEAYKFGINYVIYSLTH